MLERKYIWKQEVSINEVVDALHPDGRMSLRRLGDIRGVVIAYKPRYVCIKTMRGMPISYFDRGAVYGPGVLCQKDDMSYDFYCKWCRHEFRSHKD